MAKFLSTILLLAVLVQQAASTASLPQNKCTNAATAALAPGKATCSYITGAAQRDCCDAAATPVDVSACSSSCQQIYAELLCKLTCSKSATDGTAPVCTSNAVSFYQACSTCSAFPAPKTTTQATQTQAATSFWRQVLLDNPATPATVLADTSCTDILTQTPTVCVPTKTQDPTSLVVNINAGASDVSTIDLSTLPPNGVTAITNKQLNFVVTIGSASGCANFAAPLYGTWRVTFNDQVIVSDPTKTDSNKFTLSGDQATFTASASIYLNQYALKPGTTAQLVVVFTSVNLFGSKSITKSVTVTQPSTVTAPAGALDTLVQNCGPNPVLLGVDGTQNVNNQNANQLSTSKTSNCTILGASTTRPKLTIANGLNRFLAGEDTARTSIFDCSSKFSASLVNVELIFAGGNSLNFLDCANLQNTKITGLNQLGFPTTDAQATAITQSPVVYLDSQTSISATSQVPLGAGQAPCTIPCTTSAIAQCCPALRNSGSVTLGSGSVNLILRDRVNLNLQGTAFTIGGLELNDQSSLNIQTTGATTITCDGATNARWNSGNITVAFSAKTDSISFTGCRNRVVFGAASKMVTQGIENCNPSFATGCNTVRNDVPLVTGSASACLIIGATNNNPDICAGIKQDVTANTFTYSVSYIASNGNAPAGGALTTANNNGPMSLFANSKALFFNVNPTFGAVLTVLANAESNSFAAGSKFEVSISASLDTTRVVYIPLVICVSIGTTVTRGTCQGTTLPTVTVTNPNGRSYDLSYYGSDTTTLATFNTLFPGMIKSVAANANSQIGVIALVLQPAPAQGGSSGVVPDRTSDLFIVYLAQNLNSYPQSTFVSNVLAASNTGSEFFTVLSYGQDPNNAAQIKVVYQCKDLASTDAANNRCSNINNLLFNDPTLNAQTKAVASGGTQSQTNPPSDQSNGALFGLFALAIIPVLLIFAVVLFVISKKRAADNQYSQDTSTFSTVAAQPNPHDKYYPSTPASYE